MPRDPDPARILERADGAGQLLAKSGRVEIGQIEMLVAMDGEFVPLLNDPPDELREGAGDIAEGEEGRLDAGLAEAVENERGVADDL